MIEAGLILQQRYQLLCPIGEGLQGRQTWRCLDLQTQEMVIVKMLAFSPQWQDLRLFEREAQVLRQLQHPAIPRYRDYFAVDRQLGDGLPWFVLVQDFISGQSLQELINQGQRFSEAQVQAIAGQVLQILCYLHELKPPVLHRDIKPGNLIWQPKADQPSEFQIYLVDFGAVQERAAMTGVTFTIVGTCGYTPLEQFWGRTVPASDLYALGTTPGLFHSK